MSRLLLCLLLLLPLPANTACPPAWPDSTFLQLYTDDPPIPAERLEQWRALGVQEIILQWSAYGPPDGGPFPLVQDRRIGSLLDSAEAAGLRVRLGLRYDPAFWQPRNDEIAEEEEQEGISISSLSAYLHQRLIDQRALVEALGPLTDHAAFAGWYISDEIDDSNWNSPWRRRRLAEYLGRTTGLLQAVTPDASLAISGFSAARLPPREWAELWRELLPASGIDRLLFQDGIGAGKLELSELAYYVPILAETLERSGHGLSIIVELFEQGPEAGDFRPAPVARIKTQFEWAARAKLPPTSFALPHYADPLAGDEAARLAGELTALHEACRR